jgi:hypothetical protein
MWKAILGTACLFAVIGAARADDQADAFVELSSELTECLAYYKVGNQCAANSNIAVPGSAKLDNYLTELVVAAGQAGHMSTDAMAANMRITMGAMVKEVNKSCANFPILVDRYADSCKSLAEHPELRFSAILGGYLKQHR